MKQKLNSQAMALTAQPGPPLPAPLGPLRDKKGGGGGGHSPNPWPPLPPSPCTDLPEEQGLWGRGPLGEEGSLTLQGHTRMQPVGPTLHNRKG